jgi:hypothetical protein
MDNQTEEPDQNIRSRKISNTWIYIIIIALLLGTNIFLFLQRRQSVQQQGEITTRLDQVLSEKATLQKEYDASLARLDDLTGKNAELEARLKGRNSDITKAKSRIQTILANEHPTETQLQEARGLIKSLNVKIKEYEEQIVVLKKENRTLKTERDSTLTDNSKLQEKVNLAKILHASNIRLQPIDLRRHGRKQNETTKAKRVDLLRIIFDIDENRVAESGEKTLNIRIVNPDGDLLSNAALGSGSFTTAEGETKNYSVSKTLILKTGVPVKDIDVDWRQSADYEKGAYTVEIYHEGYLIGKASVSLR